MHDSTGGPTIGKGKKRESQSAGRQTTLFGLPSVPAQDKKSTARNKKVTSESQQTVSTETGGGDSQATEIVSENSQENQLIGSELNTQVDDEPLSDIPTGGKEPEIEEVSLVPGNQEGESELKASVWF